MRILFTPPFYYLCYMHRKWIFIIAGLVIWTGNHAQVSYLNSPELLNRVDSCLKHTYNFSFQKARMFHQELSESTPEHPAPDFLMALIVYWENFPLTPDHKYADHFLDLMNRSVKSAESMIEYKETYLEGVFFDLFGRAFKAMFWADNGKTGKLLPDLRTMYRHVIEGFDLKEQFNEFYFCTGLYNYYIEAYPEAHPVYKPLVSFMQDGDKQLGIQQLYYAIDHTTFLKVEALLFMSIIQLKYEKDLNIAVLHADRLHRTYPHNLYYQGHLITILLHQNNYQTVRALLKKMDPQQDRYSELIKELARAFMAEKETENLVVARRKYLKSIEMADFIGPFADIYQAIAYMGLSRLSEKKGLRQDANRYARKAENRTKYEFILVD